jgi:hypothetical protein
MRKIVTPPLKNQKISRSVMMKAGHIMLIGASSMGICLCQSTAPAASIITAQRASSPALPPYLVYRHFLAWVNQLDKDATASGAGDPYKFAEPFSRANLQHQQLDILRDAAHRLDADLQRHQARAQLIINRYRQEAKKALAQGESLPPAPPEIHALERERTALLIQHYVTLRADLGPDASAQLDGYLGHEFAPHMKLKRMAAPAAPAQPQPGS